MPHGSTGFTFPFYTVLVTVPIHYQDVVWCLPTNKQSFLFILCWCRRLTNLMRKHCVKDRFWKGSREGERTISTVCLYVLFCWFLVTKWDRPLWSQLKWSLLGMFNVQCFRPHLEKESIFKVCGKKRKYFRSHTHSFPEYTIKPYGAHVQFWHNTWIIFLSAEVTHRGAQASATIKFSFDPSAIGSSSHESNTGLN